MAEVDKTRLPTRAESDAQAEELGARHSAFSDATPMPGGGFYLPLAARRREKVWGRAVRLSFDDMSSADRRFIGQKQQEGTTQEGSDISHLAAGAYEFRNLYDRPLGKLIVRGDAGGENRSYKFVPGEHLEGDTLGDAKDMALSGAARLGSWVTGLTELLGVGGEDAGSVRREFDDISAEARAGLSLQARSEDVPFLSRGHDGNLRLVISPSVVGRLAVEQAPNFAVFAGAGALLGKGGAAIVNAGLIGGSTGAEILSDAENRAGRELTEEEKERILGRARVAAVGPSLLGGALGYGISGRGRFPGPAGEAIEESGTEVAQELAARLALEDPIDGVALGNAALTGAILGTGTSILLGGGVGLSGGERSAVEVAKAQKETKGKAEKEGLGEAEAQAAATARTKIEKSLFALAERGDEGLKWIDGATHKELSKIFPGIGDLDPVDAKEAVRAAVLERKAKLLEGQNRASWQNAAPPLRKFTAQGLAEDVPDGEWLDIPREAAARGMDLGEILKAGASEMGRRAQAEAQDIGRQFDEIFAADANYQEARRGGATPFEAAAAADQGTIGWDDGRLKAIPGVAAAQAAGDAEGVAAAIGAAVGKEADEAASGQAEARTREKDYAGALALGGHLTNSQLFLIGDEAAAAKDWESAEGAADLLAKRESSYAKERGEHLRRTIERATGNAKAKEKIQAQEAPREKGEGEQEASAQSEGKPPPPPESKKEAADDVLQGTVEEKTAKESTPTLVLYHGTGADFEGMPTKSESGLGHFFSEDKSLAFESAEGKLPNAGELPTGVKRIPRIIKVDASNASFAETPLGVKPGDAGYKSGGVYIITDINNPQLKIIDEGRKAAAKSEGLPESEAVERRAVKRTEKAAVAVQAEETADDEIDEDDAVAEAMGKDDIGSLTRALSQISRTNEPTDGAALGAAVRLFIGAGDKGFTERMKFKRQLPTAKVQFDAATFQHRARSSATGKTDRMLGARKYEDDTIVHVWERKDGALFVANGHQRVNLAKEKGAPEISAVVMSETDGWTAEMARAQGLRDNIKDTPSHHLQTALEIAREIQASAADAKVRLLLLANYPPTEKKLWDDGIALSRLSESELNRIDDAIPTIGTRDQKKTVDRLAKAAKQVGYPPVRAVFIGEILEKPNVSDDIFDLQVRNALFSEVESRQGALAEAAPSTEIKLLFKTRGEILIKFHRRVNDRVRELSQLLSVAKGGLSGRVTDAERGEFEDALGGARDAQIKIFGNLKADSAVSYKGDLADEITRLAKATAEGKRKGGDLSEGDFLSLLLAAEKNYGVDISAFFAEAKVSPKLPSELAAATALESESAPATFSADAAGGRSRDAVYSEFAARLGDYFEGRASAEEAQGGGIFGDEQVGMTAAEWREMGAELASRSSHYAGLPNDFAAALDEAAEKGMDDAAFDRLRGLAERIAHGKLTSGEEGALRFATLKPPKPAKAKEVKEGEALDAVFGSATAFDADSRQTSVFDESGDGGIFSGPRVTAVRTTGNALEVEVQVNGSRFVYTAADAAAALNTDGWTDPQNEDYAESQSLALMAARDHFRKINAVYEQGDLSGGTSWGVNARPRKVGRGTAIYLAKGTQSGDKDGSMELFSGWRQVGLDDLEWTKDDRDQRRLSYWSRRLADDGGKDRIGALIAQLTEKEQKLWDELHSLVGNRRDAAADGIERDWGNVRQDISALKELQKRAASGGEFYSGGDGGTVGLPAGFIRAMRDLMSRDKEFKAYLVRRGESAVRAGRGLDASDYALIGEEMARRGVALGGSDAAATAAALRPGMTNLDSGLLPVPPSIVGDYNGTLAEEQRLGVDMILSAHRRGLPGFFLMDAQGVGKTRQMLAAAHEMAKEGKRVLLIAPSRQVVEVYYREAESLGLSQMRGIHFATYADVRRRKIKNAGDYAGVFFDEAQEIRNPQTGKSKEARELADGAEFVLWATGTPFDKPTGVAYFASRLLGEAEGEIISRLGLVEKQVVVDGEPQYFEDGSPRMRFEVKRGLSWGEDVRSAIVELREDMVARGLAVRRELPFWGDIKFERAEHSAEWRAGYDAVSLHFAGLIGAAYSPRAAFSLAGQRIQTLSRLTESEKASAIIRTIKRERAAGRSVAVFLEGVDEGRRGHRIRGLPPGTKAGWETSAEEDVGLIPTATEQVEAALEAEGIEFARVYGGKQDKSSEIRRFQTNQVDVVIATPQSGGVGISLDDQSGGAPRTAIIGTLNFSAAQVDQILFRISRRQTRSRSRAVFLINEASESDTRRREIFQMKASALTAIQQGRDPTSLLLEIGQMEADLRAEEGAAEADDVANARRADGVIVEKGGEFYSGGAAASPGGKVIVEITTADGNRFFLGRKRGRLGEEFGWVKSRRLAIEYSSDVAELAIRNQERSWKGLRARAIAANPTAKPKVQEGVGLFSLGTTDPRLISRTAQGLRGIFLPPAGSKRAAERNRKRLEKRLKKTLARTIVGRDFSIEVGDDDAMHADGVINFGAGRIRVARAAAENDMGVDSHEISHAVFGLLDEESRATIRRMAERKWFAEYKGQIKASINGAAAHLGRPPTRSEIAVFGEMEALAYAIQAHREGARSIPLAARILNMLAEIWRTLTFQRTEADAEQAFFRLILSRKIPTAVRAAEQFGRMEKTRKIFTGEIVPPMLTPRYSAHNRRQVGNGIRIAQAQKLSRTTALNNLRIELGNAYRDLNAEVLEIKEGESYGGHSAAALLEELIGENGDLVNSHGTIVRQVNLAKWRGILGAHSQRTTAESQARRRPSLSAAGESLFSGLKKRNEARSAASSAVAEMARRQRNISPAEFINEANRLINAGKARPVEAEMAREFFGDDTVEPMRAAAAKRDAALQKNNKEKETGNISEAAAKAKAKEINAEFRKENTPLEARSQAFLEAKKAVNGAEVAAAIDARTKPLIYEIADVSDTQQARDVEDIAPSRDERFNAVTTVVAYRFEGEEYTDEHYEEANRNPVGVASPPKEERVSQRVQIYEQIGRAIGINSEHFGRGTAFWVRYEDGRNAAREPIRRIVEIQSDIWSEQIPKVKNLPPHLKSAAKQYFRRAVDEEIARAQRDGIAELHFPSWQTAAQTQRFNDEGEVGGDHSTSEILASEPGDEVYWHGEKSIVVSTDERRARISNIEGNQRFYKESDFSGESGISWEKDSTARVAADAVFHARVAKMTADDFDRDTLAKALTGNGPYGKAADEFLEKIATLSYSPSQLENQLQAAGKKQKKDLMALLRDKKISEGRYESEYDAAEFFANKPLERLSYPLQQAWIARQQKRVKDGETTAFEIMRDFWRNHTHEGITPLAEFEIEVGGRDAKGKYQSQPEQAFIWNPNLITIAAGEGGEIESYQENATILKHYRDEGKRLERLYPQAASQETHQGGEGHLRLDLSKMEARTPQFFSFAKGAEGQIAKAEEMKTAGETPDTIWRATRLVHEPNENEWLREISPGRLRKKAVEDFHNRRDESLTASTRLGDIYDAPALYRRFPELRNVEIRRPLFMASGAGFGFRDGKPIIHLGYRTLNYGDTQTERKLYRKWIDEEKAMLRDRSLPFAANASRKRLRIWMRRLSETGDRKTKQRHKEELLDALEHEIQHYLDWREGRSAGASANAAAVGRIEWDAAKAREMWTNSAEMAGLESAEMTEFGKALDKHLSGSVATLEQMEALLSEIPAYKQGSVARTMEIQAYLSHVGEVRASESGKRSLMKYRQRKGLAPTFESQTGFLVKAEQKEDETQFSIPPPKAAMRGGKYDSTKDPALANIADELKDENGKPRVFYHGTDGDLTDFSPVHYEEGMYVRRTQNGEEILAYNERMIFFTDDEYDALDYRNRWLEPDEIDAGKGMLKTVHLAIPQSRIFDFRDEAATRRARAEFIKDEGANALREGYMGGGWVMWNDSVTDWLLDKKGIWMFRSVNTDPRGRGRVQEFAISIAHADKIIDAQDGSRLTDEKKPTAAQKQITEKYRAQRRQDDQQHGERYKTDVKALNEAIPRFRKSPTAENARLMGRAVSALGEIVKYYQEHKKMGPMETEYGIYIVREAKDDADAIRVGNLLLAERDKANAAAVAEKAVDDGKIEVSISGSAYQLVEPRDLSPELSDALETAQTIKRGRGTQLRARMTADEAIELAEALDSEADYMSESDIPTLEGSALDKLKAKGFRKEVARLRAIAKSSGKSLKPKIDKEMRARIKEHAWWMAHRLSYEIPKEKGLKGDAEWEERKRIVHAFGIIGAVGMWSMLTDDEKTGKAFDWKDDSSFTNLARRMIAAGEKKMAAAVAEKAVDDGKIEVSISGSAYQLVEPRDLSPELSDALETAQTIKRGRGTQLRARMTADEAIELAEALDSEADYMSESDIPTLEGSALDKLKAKGFRKEVARLRAIAQSSGKSLKPKINKGMRSRIKQRVWDMVYRLSNEIVQEKGLKGDAAREEHERIENAFHFIGEVGMWSMLTDDEKTGKAFDWDDDSSFTNLARRMIAAGEKKMAAAAAAEGGE